MIYIFDGAMGTMLQENGLPPGYCPELWNVEHPEKVTAVHKRYVESGADIIETNTFGANRIKLSHYHLSEEVTKLNLAAVKAARDACGPNTKIAGSVGSTGKFIAPLGDLPFETAYNVFLEQVSALDEGGVDYISIETFLDIQEMRAALLAAKAATTKPIICQLTFSEDGRTVTGTDPATAAVILEALGADIIGANCSLGPDQFINIIKTMASHCQVPLSAQPNAGIPELINGQTSFPMGPKEFASWATKLIDAGASYIGGCCGTTPAHIKEIRAAISGHVPSHRPATISHTALASRSKVVFLGEGLPTAIIGERINPTGRKALAADIKAGNFSTIKKEALDQVKAGAHILDVNMGVPGIDQAATMRQVIGDLSLLVNVPLAIDTTDAATLEAGLRIYPGRALINSITAEPERLEEFLPLAKKYGAAILCLPIAAAGVPTSVEERLQIAGTIVNKALDAGLRTKDLLLDALVMTIAADATAAQQTLETLRQYRRTFGFPTVMGLSNISFGLPRREQINSAFYAMAIASGLDAPILNPYNQEMVDMRNAAAALLGHDPSGHHYSLTYAASAPITQTPEKNSQPNNPLSAAKQAIINGEKEAVPELIRTCLASGHTPLEITNEALTAAMNEVGVAFGKGRCYLPQVMLAAETMRAAFLTIKEAIPAHETISAGTIILATVQGDIHDLGKNIVSALLENNGFTVIDLGKDVSPDTIIQAAEKHKPDIIGLCALMTTTMPQIDETISILKKKSIPAKTIVGGAVLTAEYAEQAGADAYAPDGIAAVNIVKHLLGK
ncbi:MAG: metH 2 [Firmicutes bacterium]|nr:metH 2 [Bacillota bacterium]